MLAVRLPVRRGGGGVSLNPIEVLRARRMWANSDPYTEAERESFRQTLAEGRSLRRRRRRSRWSLLKRLGGES